MSDNTKRSKQTAKVKSPDKYKDHDGAGVEKKSKRGIRGIRPIYQADLGFDRHAGFMIFLSHQ